MLSMPFQTHESEARWIPRIRELMIFDGHSENFVRRVCEIATVDEGVFELLMLWTTSVDYIEQHDIINDLLGTVEDYDYED